MQIPNLAILNKMDLFKQDTNLNCDINFGGQKVYYGDIIQKSLGLNKILWGKKTNRDFLKKKKKKFTTFALNKCPKQIKLSISLRRCAPISKLPSYVSTIIQNKMLPQSDQVVWPRSFYHSQCGFQGNTSCVRASMESQGTCSTLG